MVWGGGGGQRGVEGERAAPSSPRPRLPLPLAPAHPDSVKGRGFPELPEGCSQLVLCGTLFPPLLHPGPLLVLGSPLTLGVFPDPTRPGWGPQQVPPSPREAEDPRKLKPRVPPVHILTPLMRFGASAFLNLQLTFSSYKTEVAHGSCALEWLRGSNTQPSIRIQAAPASAAIVLQALTSLCNFCSLCD